MCATNTDESDTSLWSAVRTFTTSDAPTLSSPSDGVVYTANVGPTVNWNTITGASHYILAWDTASTFDSPIASTYSTASTSRTLTPLKFGTTYYWRVCATNSNDSDTSSWSAVWRFTTSDAPVLTSPADGTAFSSYSNSRLTVYWNSVTGADHYILEWDTAATFNSPLFATFTASGTSVYITEAELQYGTTYYWRVCAINSNAPDTSSWSTVWRFTTPYQLTTGPTLISPANDSSDIDFQSALALQWNTLANVNGYRYQVSTSSDFSTLFAQGTTAQTTASIHNLRPATTYYWRVQGYNGVGNSVWSAVWHFTTDGCPTIGTSFSHEICEGDSYDFFGRTLSSSGDYTETLTTELGCDSTITLHLTVHPTVTELVEVTVCESELPYHYVDGDINTTFEVGTPNLSVFNFQFSTQHGCDSTVILMVNIVTATEGDTTATACSSFSWHGYTNLTESGDYTDVMENAAGCDSTVTLHLTINVPTEGDTIATACGSFNWHGYTNLTESGDYTDVIENAAGCDSIVTLHLTINVPTESDTTATVCGSYSWHGYTNLTESGDYTDVLTNAAGCDSIVTLHLTINTPTESDTSATACGSFSWHGYTNLTESGDYTDVLENAAGCDSIVTLHLTINVPTEGDTTATACGSFNWHSYTNLTESGDYTDVLENAAGCDSIVTLHLTINVPTESDTSATACSSFNWHGYTNLTESGDYTDVLENAAGCDSTVTLHLTINMPTEGDTTATACGSFNWHGYTNLTESGDYTDVLENAAGCDSTVTLHLTINTPTEGDTTATACGSFNWHGYPNLTESGNYTDVLENAAGCDSTVTLHLTIHTLPEVTINGETSFCEGGSTILTASGAETYEWSTMEFGAEFEVAEAGTYTVIGTDANGCTSTASIEVTETTINTEVYFVEVGDGFLEAFQGDAEYQWIDCTTHEPIAGATQQQFTPEVSGSYACVITLGECTDTTECMDFSVGVEEWNDGSITIYPNPSTGMVNIHLAPQTSAYPEIHVFDVYGRRMQILEMTDATTQIDLSQYATGVYLLKLVNQSQIIAVLKVVKE